MGIENDNPALRLIRLCKGAASVTGAPAVSAPAIVVGKKVSRNSTRLTRGMFHACGAGRQVSARSAGPSKRGMSLRIGETSLYALVSSIMKTAALPGPSLLRQARRRAFPPHCHRERPPRASENCQILPENFPDGHRRMPLISRWHHLF